jgi:hypothetical protein
LEVIPDLVKQFIAKHVRSIDVLEILLLFNRQRDKALDALVISKELHLNAQSVEVRLEQLFAHKLLSRESETERPYRYLPSTAESESIDELAKWYATHRVAIVTLILSQVSEEIRTYPDSSGID